jgi:amino acid permease
MISRYTWLQNILAVIFISLNLYGLRESLKYNSLAGFLFSIASIVALVFCMQILQHLKKADAELEDRVN